MKSKEDIIYDQTGIKQGARDLTPMDYGECKACMDIYAAQEVEKAKSEVCKWSESDYSHEFMTTECGFVEITGASMDYTYCPFCGRKIERI